MLGAVASCYVLESGRCVAVRLASLPSMNAITINGGYVYVTPTALNAATAVGADLPALLRDGGLDVHDGDEKGKTVWNAQGRRGIHALDPSWHDEAVVSELLLAVAA